LIDLKNLCKNQQCYLRCYFVNSEVPLHVAVVACDKKYTPMNLANPDVSFDVVARKERLEQWSQKALHGKFPYSLSLANPEASLLWLRDGTLYPETEGFMVAIQDQVIDTRNRRKHILRQNVVDICRLCNQFQETISHISTGCPALANTEYLARHNLTAAIVHHESA
ncbi:unnamed protein product, partial [Ectocarpus sp. 12 AP-2014]